MDALRTGASIGRMERHGWTERSRGRVGGCRMVHIEVDVVNIEEVGILDIWGEPTLSCVSKPGGLFGVVDLRGSAGAD